MAQKTQRGQFNKLLVLLMKYNKVGGNCIFCLNKFGLFILYLNLNLRPRVLRVNSFPEGSTWANLLRTSLCLNIFIGHHCFNHKQSCRSRFQIPHLLINYSAFSVQYDLVLKSCLVCDCQPEGSPPSGTQTLDSPSSGVLLVSPPRA